MKKTKIICTMGPNTGDRELLKALALNGMDIARFNFSHGDYEEQKGRLDLLKSVREELDIPVAALLDTKGPEIRTGLLKDEKKVTLKEGDTYTLTTRDIVGDEHIGHINYAGLNEDVVPGNKILIDDGLIELEVEKVDGTDIVCRVVNGGELGMRKGVNVPNVKIKLAARSVQFWTRTQPIWASSRRLRTRRESRTSTRSSRRATASWWPAAIWAWRSRRSRFPTSRS